MKTEIDLEKAVIVCGTFFYDHLNPDDKIKKLVEERSGKILKRWLTPAGDIILLCEGKDEN